MQVNMNHESDSAEVSSDEDQHILCFLDALDLILRHRETLAQNLSRGWMDIASARYSMGHSRINQALFSLKPSEPSVLVSVLPADEGQDVKRAPNLVFRIKDTNVPDCTTEASTNSEEESSKSQIDSDENSGVSNNQPGAGVEEKNNSVNKTMKKKSDPLTWFGALVSPHLRTAQCSFAEALEILVEIATAQSTLLKEYQKIQCNGGCS